MRIPTNFRSLCDTFRTTTAEHVLFVASTKVGAQRQLLHDIALRQKTITDIHRRMGTHEAGRVLRVVRRSRYGLRREVVVEEGV